VSLISAINSGGHTRFRPTESGGVNAAVFIEVLDRLAASTKRTIILIVDRGAAHRATRAGAFVPTLGIALVLSASRCAPDRNPDALVGKHLQSATRKDEFGDKVRRALRDLQNAARQIISFFRKPSRKYAA
jgi:hypothetical protein